MILAILCSTTVYKQKSVIPFAPIGDELTTSSIQFARVSWLSDDDDEFIILIGENHEE